MNTRDKIIKKAVFLFNKNGYSSVTMRDIADSMNISVGNVTYHFNKKSDLVSAIIKMQYEDYKNLDMNTDVDIPSFNKHLGAMLEFQRQYYFYLNNIIELSKLGPDILKLQIKVKNEFVEYFAKVIEHFENKELFQHSPSDNYRKRFASGIVLLMRSWIEQTALDQKELHQELLNIVWTFFYSILTEKGLALHKRYFNQI